MIKLKSIDIQKASIALLVVPVSEDTPLQTEPLTSMIEKATGLNEFSGKQDEELMLYHLPNTNI
ncbi:MAG: hypothetical protein P8Y38_12520, partial [Deltaproteobacteria bacterium]